MRSTLAYWLRPVPNAAEAVRWHVLEAPRSPGPDCLGPFSTLDEARAVLGGVLTPA